METGVLWDLQHSSIFYPFPISYCTSTTALKCEEEFLYNIYNLQDSNKIAKAD